MKRRTLFTPEITSQHAHCVWCKLGSRFGWQPAQLRGSWLSIKRLVHSSATPNDLILHSAGEHHKRNTLGNARWPHLARTFCFQNPTPPGILYDAGRRPKWASLEWPSRKPERSACLHGTYTYNVRILERKVTRENATRWRSPPQSQRAPDQPPRPCTIVAQPGIPCGPSRLRSGGPGAPNTRRMKTGVSQEHGMRDGSRPAGHMQSRRSGQHSTRRHVQHGTDTCACARARTCEYVCVHASTPTNTNTTVHAPIHTRPGHSRGGQRRRSQAPGASK